MKKNKKNILLILCIIFLMIGLFSVVFPFYENSLIKEEKGNDTIMLNDSESIERDITLKSNFVQGFQFYLSKNQWRTETSVKIYFDDELIYNNVLINVSGAQNALLLPKTLHNHKGEKVHFVMKTNKTDNMPIVTNKENQILIDQITHKKSYKTLFYSSIFLIILFTIYMFSNSKKEKNNKHINKIVLYFLYFAFSLLTGICALKISYIVNYRKYLGVAFPLLFYIIAIFTVIISKKLYNNSEKKIEKIFLIMAIPICSLYCVFLLPTDGQDEYRHYGRINTILNGEIFLKGNGSAPDIVRMSKGINLEEFVNYASMDFSYNKTRVIDAANYPSSLYLFSSFGIYLGKLLNVNPYIAWYLGKIFNMLAFLFLGYLIIKKTPKYKLLFCAYLLIPMNIYQAVTLSADTLINLSALYILAIVLTIKEKHISKLSEIVLFGVCAYIIMAGKIVYLPLVLLCLLMLKKYLTDKRDKKKFILSFLLAFGAFGVMKYISSNVSNVMQFDDLLFSKSNGFYTIYHPFQTAYVLIQYFFTNFDEIFINFIGIRFIWSTRAIDMMYPATYLLLLCFTTQFEYDNSEKKDLKSVIFIIIAWCLAFALIVEAMYAFEFTSNPVLGKVWGVQGRYFYPVNILLLILLSKIPFINKKICKENYAYTGIIIIHLFYLIEIFKWTI